MPKLNIGERSVAVHHPFKIILLIVVLITAGLGRQNSALALRGEKESQTPDLSGNLFGADFVKLNVEAGLDQMADAGAVWARRSAISWASIEPNKGDRNWSAIDFLRQELETAASLNYQVILPVNDTPDWAQAVPGVFCGPIKQAEFTAFAAFMADLVVEYGDLIDYYEIWNEPDAAYQDVSPDSGYGCWGDSSDTQYFGGDYYGEMLKVVYPQMKSARPDAQVLVGGLMMDCNPDQATCSNPNASKFLDGMLASGAGDYFDGISYHAYDYYYGVLGQYGNPNWGTSSDTTGPVVAAKANFIRNALAEYGLEDKYLINSESAVVCSSDCDEVYESTKAYYLAEAFASGLSQDLRASIWYSTRANWRSTNLFDVDLAPYPAYHAFDVANDYMTSLRAVFPITRYPGFHGYELLSNTSRVWMLWSRDGTDRTLDLPDVPNMVVNALGQVIAPTQEITIGVEPIYITFDPEFKVLLPSVAKDPPLVLNSGFEEGLDAFGNPIDWIFRQGGEGLDYNLVTSNPTSPYIDTTIPLGSASVILGSTAYPCSDTGVPIGYASIEQEVDLREYSSGARPVLHFDYIIYTQDGSAQAGDYDRFEVYVQSGASQDMVFWDGRNLSTVNCSNWYRIPTSGWKHASIDLSSPMDYRGDLITISFRNYNRYDHWFNTFTYLDNVRIEFVN